jgi:hypothetical protein
MSAMTKCPRCNLEQEKSPQCKYCGLVFEDSSDPPPASKAIKTKRTALFAAILVVAGALLGSYLFIAYQGRPGDKATGNERSSHHAKKTDEDNLWKTAKELSGDVGIMNDLTGDYSKGSILAMILFSVIGLGYFAYGKKSQQFLMLVCGIALMGYSYFVNGTGNIILIGIGLGVLPFIFGRK